MQPDGAVALFDLRADIHQQALHGADIAYARDAAERDRLIGEQGRGQRRKG